MQIPLSPHPDHGFDQPLALLSDCHRRIERFLKAMLTVATTERGQRLSPRGADALLQACQYFATAGPRHTEDEEQSLHPRLRESSDPKAAELLAIAARLEADHREAESHHALVDRLARRWVADGVLDAAAGDELVEHLQSLQRLYARHIDTEDHELLPAAARVLSAAQVERIGREMAARRHVPFAPPIELRRSSG